MRPMICFVTLGLLALGAAQVIEERSSIRNPDGSTTHNTKSSFSQASYSEMSTGPDGATVGKNLHRDSTGKITGNEWTVKDGQKIETKSVDDSDIGARSTLGGFGGVGGAGTGFGPSFGSPGFGAGIGPAFRPGIEPGIGGVGTPNFGAGYAGFPNGGLPWANFGNFGGQSASKFVPPTSGQAPPFDYAFGFQRPISVPNYSKFLLGGVGFNPNIVSDGHFANIMPNLGFGSGFGGVRSGFGGVRSGFSGDFGNPGFVQRSYKQEIEPASGKQSYSYSESSGHSSTSATGGS